MSETPYIPPGSGEGLSMFSVVIGGAAVLSILAVPIALLFALRHYGLLSSSVEHVHRGGTPGTIFPREELQQEEPKLFDVYIKPSLEVAEARLKDILKSMHIQPTAVRTMNTDLIEQRRATSATNTASDPPSTLRAYYTMVSHGLEVDKPEAFVKEDLSKSYDVAVLIVMPTPHPCVADHWDGLGGHAIGTIKLATAFSLGDSIYR
ncbi:hypothetical protein BDM02DRAFT_3183978 [Thelephora ganbajun]|uniref:Uncharacterized protein n=1 Tax=Thelephora ganbajun TaxID=370292 RepID=A0ACB6ZQX8_THEGA|nr:hypothetical protein BDM02DRAFT_3183978 [Thelephora ganbajun]